MSKPIVAVFSSDSSLPNALQQHVGDCHEILACSDFNEFAGQLLTPDVAIAIVNLRRIVSGGHREASVLEDVLQERRNLPVLLLTDDECPEPLERLVAVTGIAHVRNGMTADDLKNWFASVTPEVTPVQTPRQTNKPPVTPTKGREIVNSPQPQSIVDRFETRTPQLKRMLEDLEVAARHNVTILLIGETGAGKTYLSRLIHEASPRHDEPFLPVACGALPSELIESELFGHMKGSFTSAHADKEGKFIAAGRGTILLDEIDVLGPEQQVKLLRVIETGEFEAVGSNVTLKSQARLVVASNLELQPLVEQGKFRPDLYYRLNMLKFEIPPLRERKPDIGPLAQRFIDQLSKKHDVVIHEIEESFYDALYQYPWPGNVRELENVIQRAVIFSRDGVLAAEHLPSHIVMNVAGPTNDPSVKLGRQTAMEPRDLGEQVAMTEQDIIEQSLFKNNYSRTQTAKELGISRVTLYNKMKKYGIGQ